MNTDPQKKRPYYIKKAAIIASTGIILLLALFVAQPVFAAEIVVDGSTCTLADAITAANTNTASGGCPAGDDVGGYDTIDLQTDVVLTAELPQIESDIVLNGNGRTVDGNDSFRVLTIFQSSNVTLNDITISGGYALESAGIYALAADSPEDGALVTINNSIITGNNAKYSDPFAISVGGIRNDVNNTMEINNSTITDNSTDYHAGGIYNAAYSTMTINNSTISANSAAYGGGLFIRETSTTTINSSTISANSAVNQGGGLYLNGHITQGSIVTINHSTITQNMADQSGGGIYVEDLSEAVLNLNLISGNNASVGAEIRAHGIVTAANYNVVGYGGSARSHGFMPSGTDIIPPGPLVFILDNSLTDNGGTTPTHALKSNSVAKDAAPNAICLASPANGWDQRGAARNFDLDGSDTANECDIGAHEMHETISVGTCFPTFPDLNGPQIFDFSSGNSVIIEVISANGLKCLTVEEMGPGTNHLYAAQANVADLDLETDNWWHITSNNVSGFDVDVTLPYAAADGGSRLCEWLGGTGSIGWDCASGIDSSHAENSSVTRYNVSSFSDWTVGAATCPAAETPMASIDLTGANDTDVLLSWTDNPANSGGYAVYRSQTPYFTADAATLHETLPPASTSTGDMGAAGSANMNYFYIVRGLNSCGAASDYAQRLGAFNFEIFPGS